ncbi:MAG: YraN family protein [candidate division Zixibacteria bacterium]|nr:YraN family protein [candidate division Zixibacteria bacterium]
MNKHSPGHRYEKAAQEFLRNKGYQIITTNYRYKRKEIDIICSSGNELVFVEVKGGGSATFGDPVYKVDGRKRQAIIEVARGYLAQSLRSYRSYRFDVIIVNDIRGELQIEHRQGAFTL